VHSCTVVVTRERALMTVLAALLVASYASFAQAPASNESSRFAAVRAMVERGGITIDPDAATTADLARRGDHVYSDKAPGTALLAVPAYAAYAIVVRQLGADLPAFARESQLRGQAALGEDRLFLNPAFRRAVYVCNLSTNVVAGVALGLAFLGLLQRWGVRARDALLATLALGLGSQIFAYSTMFFGHVLAAAALFGAFVCLDRVPTGPRRWTIAAGFLAGLGVLIELPVVLGAAILAVSLATMPAPDARTRWRRVAGFAAGAVGPLVALAWYQTVAFGAPWSTGYAHVANPTFAAGMAHGILGVGWPRPVVLLQLLLSPSRGLFYLSPVLALAAWGLVCGVRAPGSRHRALTALAIVVAFWLLNGGYYMWWGGAALGPRHCIPALPFLALGFAWYLPAPGWRGDLFVVLLAVSLVSQLAAVAVSPLAPPGVDALFAYVYPQLVHGTVARLPGSSNLGMWLGLHGPASLLPLLLLWSAAAVALARLTSETTAPG
jgi:hypothetical protein